MSLFFLCAILLCIKETVVKSYSIDAVNDKVLHLPGAEKLDIRFNHFSGYLPIQGKGSLGDNSKNMHYWFVESLSNPSTDPIAFWTNGGPGCSGLIAFFTEQGPFRPNADGSLSPNAYAWNRVSNMVFIESPTGVGFSYSNSTEDLKSSDNSTALDNFNLIQSFFARFPEYRNNSMYLTSESYGGHYIPMLAKLIVDENALGHHPHLNLKGMAIGNPYTDDYSGTPAMIDTFWGHQLISKPLYEAYKRQCSPNSKSGNCSQLISYAIDGIGNLNYYALDFDRCLSPPLAPSSSLSLQNYGELSGSTGRYSKTRNEQKLQLLNHFNSHLSTDERKLLSLRSTQKYEPCEDDFTWSYLTNIDVKKAIHVKEDIAWQSCSDIIDYDNDGQSISTAPIYNYLIDGHHGLDILVYSGDDDAVCSTLGSQKWIWKLGYPVSSTWQPHKYDGQTAGYLTKFKNAHLSFLTVHGAGHEVPTYQPAVAFDMWVKYLSGELTK